MKKRKSIGFRWIGNRTVIGIVCMIAAIGICFGIAPTVQKLSAGKTTILRVTRTVPRGSCLTEADVETVEVGSYGLSRDILRDKTAAVGKYATTDLYAGEYGQDGCGRLRRRWSAMRDELQTVLDAVQVEIIAAFR